MLIVNHSADYSANNIGRVDLPVELNELAQAIVDQYTSVTLNSVQKSALNTLTSTLSTSGIYSKINLLLFPCLASTVAECYLDVINKDSSISDGDGGSSYVLSDISLHSKYGIYQSSVPSSSNKSPFKTARSYSGTVSLFGNCHVLTDREFCMGNFDKSNDATAWFNKKNTFSARKGAISNGIGINNHTWAVNSDYSEVITYTLGVTLTTSNFFDYINGSKQTVEVVGGYEGIINSLNTVRVCPFFPTSLASTYYNSNPVSVWGTASGLTDAESKTLCDALTAFQAAFFAD